MGLVAACRLAVQVRQDDFPQADWTAREKGKLVFQLVASAVVDEVDDLQRENRNGCIEVGVFQKVTQEGVAVVALLYLDKVFENLHEELQVDFWRAVPVDLLAGTDLEESYVTSVYS